MQAGDAQLRLYPTEFSEADRFAPLDFKCLRMLCQKVFKSFGQYYIPFIYYLAKATNFKLELNAKLFALHWTALDRECLQ